MKEYARSNLSESSIEIISEYINDKIIPKIVIDEYSVEKHQHLY